MSEPIRIAGFGGAALALHPKLLAPEIGVASLNQKPGRGDLRPWMQPLAVASTSGPGRKTLYRFGRDLASDANYWFQWSTPVHPVRVFLADDPTERTYYTGDGIPKVTDNAIGLAGAPFPTAWRPLGVPRPITAPLLTQTAAGTGATEEDRFYVYCYVTDFGEVSAPSPVSARVTCLPGATFDITNIAEPPAGNYGITTVRIYRTVTGASGTADFFFLRDIALATTSTDDARDVGADTLESNGPVGTTGRAWLMPPADLACLTTLWNGMLAGITGRAVRICEPGKGYAWPAQYEILCDDTPVALAAFDKTLVILTSGAPLIAGGNEPLAMDAVPALLQAPCVAPRSVVAMKTGVAWASADGLAWVGASGAPQLLTAGLLTREDWQALNPASMVGAQYLGLYFAAYTVGGVTKALMINPGAAGGIYFLDQGFDAAYYDPLQQQLYVLQGTVIKKWDAGATAMTATFRSKEFRLPSPENLGAGKVIADGWPVVIKVYADGVLKMTRSVTSSRSFSLPAGFAPDSYQVEVSTAKPVTGVLLAACDELLAYL